MAVVFSFAARERQAVRVNLQRQAEVLLVDEDNYGKRRAGLDYMASGGLFTTTPAIIEVPRPGLWHLIVEGHDQAETSASLMAA